MSKDRNPPIDAPLRERFAKEIERSFSVIAPAGVGKTSAITDRIISIATSSEDLALSWLPSLVVVTYTNKAADEMYQRARNALIARRVGLPILSAFNRAFFGTIHSFCVRLLKQYGHWAGLPARFEPVENDDELWAEFIRRTGHLAPNIEPEAVKSVIRTIDLDGLYFLARQLSKRPPVQAEAPGLPPAVNIEGILAQKPKRKNSEATYEASKRAAREWLALWKSGAPFAPAPTCRTSVEEFVEAWQRAFEPFMGWRRKAVLAVAADLAEAYRAFRRNLGALTFDDQIDLALALIKHPDAGARIRREGYRVILDEAQDTDPLQFVILTEVARPANAQGIWLESAGGVIAPPDPGRFCMVGDPQQSIYSDRASLAVYEKVRQKLVSDGAGEELVFTVTFRCDQAIIDVTNRLVEPMFKKTSGQVAYTPLTPRPHAGPGQVVRWDLPPPSEGAQGVDRRTIEAGAHLGRMLASAGLQGLGVAQWADVAVLCARAKWLNSLAIGLREAGLASQLHSKRGLRADRPAYAWFTALLYCLSNPEDDYELVGLLREYYGIPDEDLARWIASPNRIWSVRRPPEGDDPISCVLRELAELSQSVAVLPLRDAVEQILHATAFRERVESAVAAEVHEREDARAEVDEEISALLARAADAESRGLSLAAFADELRDGMGDEMDAVPIARDAVQLLTIHKAKGLQWPVVVLPLLFRNISEKIEYPHLIAENVPGAEPTIVFSGKELDPLLARLEAERNRELQRLLYVGLTRAQRTLIVTNDSAYFAQKQSSRSFADLLGLRKADGTRCFDEVFDNLPTKLGEPESVAIPAAPPETPSLSEPPGSAVVQAAIEATNRIPRRVLPYALSEAEARAERGLIETDSERTPEAEQARAYGIWWHEMIEHLPWSSSTQKQREYCKQALETCPLPERGAHEIELLIRSELFQRLNDSNLIRRVEMPILWRKNDAEAIEGVLDVAIWDPEKGRWTIIDWKTNEVSKANAVEHLRSIYTPQLCAYAEALHAISRDPVDAGVYSTATGLWIPVP